MQRRGIKAHRGKRMSGAEFKRLWLDPDVKVQEIAEKLDVTATAVRSRAKRRGLPARHAMIRAERQRRLAKDPLLKFMLEHGVSKADIQRYFGTGHRQLARITEELGIQRSRGDVSRWNKMSLQEALLRWHMAKSAQETRELERRLKSAQRSGQGIYNGQERTEQLDTGPAM